ncbi:hypothetical protein AAG906_022926 [Vitis piasezkii]
MAQNSSSQVSSSGAPRVESKKYGDCIERVGVQSKAQDKGPPLFGMILGGTNDAKFTINGRTLWCKKYQARKNQRR